MRQFALHPQRATTDEVLVAEMLRSKEWPDITLTDKFCHYDLLVRDANRKPVAVVEVKRRAMDWGQYPTVHVSETKVQRCLQEAKSLGASFYFAVLCDTGLFIAELTPAVVAGLQRKVGGRRDRGFQHDIETLVDIPISLFEKINPQPK